MGVPNHYSHDITARCRSLIKHLLPFVRCGLPDDTEFGGPLSTTFLLALATPMIVLPFERIYKPGERPDGQVGDDRHLDCALAGELGNVLGDDRFFGDAPFAKSIKWGYVSAYPPFNIADRWPEDLLDALAAPEAVENAFRTPANRILRDLRNALAHGGVAYLDEHGRNTDGQAAMFGFVGAILRDRKVIGLNVLRVREEEFVSFLNDWADWLNRQTSVLKAINERDPIEAGFGHGDL